MIAGCASFWKDKRGCFTKVDQISPTLKSATKLSLNNQPVDEKIFFFYNPTRIEAGKQYTLQIKRDGGIGSGAKIKLIAQPRRWLNALSLLFRLLHHCVFSGGTAVFVQHQNSADDVDRLFLFALASMVRCRESFIYLVLPAVFPFWLRRDMSPAHFIGAFTWHLFLSSPNDRGLRAVFPNLECLFTCVTFFQRPAARVSLLAFKVCAVDFIFELRSRRDCTVHERL